MPTLSATIRAAVAVTYSETIGLATLAPQVTIPSTSSFTLANGTAAGQANRLYQAVRSHTGTGDLDLSGVLADLYGATITAARLKTIVVHNQHATATLVMEAGTNAMTTIFGAGTHTLNIRAGGLLLLHAPDATAYAITAGTADILRFDAGGATIPYEIGLILSTA